MTDSNKITNNAGIIIGNMQAAVILDIAVASYFYTINIAANSNIEPCTAVFFHFYFTNQIGTFKSMCFFVDFRHLPFKFF